MPFNSDVHSRQLEYVKIDTSFTEADYRIGASIFLPFGLFLVFQAYPRMKITHILMSIFFIYALVGSDLSSGKDISTIGVGVAKIIGGGSVVAVAALYWNWIGFSILGMLTGSLPLFIILQQFSGESTIANQQAVLNSYQTLIAFSVLGGMIIPCILKEKIVIPFSVILGVSMLTLSGAIFMTGEKYYSTMNQYKFPFLIIQIGVAVLGFVVQYYFKNKEDKVQQEVIRQKNEEAAKSAEAINSYYQNANTIQDPRAVAVPIYARPMPMPMTMGYPPAMQHSIYQPPPAYNRMNVSGNQQQKLHGNPASPPPKNESISVQDIKANLENIHIKSNKQYDF